MLQEKVIIMPIDIRLKGEIKAFQVKIPSDAKRIIGFETTVKGIDFFSLEPLPVDGTFSFLPSMPCGEIRLQSCGRSNLFYAAHVKFADRNLWMGDFAQKAGFERRMWTHGYQRWEDEVLIHDCCPVIRGIYHDRVGERVGTDVVYSVNLYVWYSTGAETTTKVKNGQP